MKNKMNKQDIKYIVCDVDGTLTDGGVYYDSTGNEIKKFNIKDGAGFLIAKKNGFEFIILTGRKSLATERRMQELGVTHVYQNVIDKQSFLRKFVEDKHLNLSNFIYIGDDLIDLPCMNLIKNAGGAVACPSDAVNDVKIVSDYISNKEAGKGAVRNIIEWLLKPESELLMHRKLNVALLYLQKLNYESLKEGETEVDTDFYYIVQRYNTKDVSKCQFESHKKYVDIQIMVEGSEIMDLADISRLYVKQSYNSEDDYILWNEPERFTRTTLRQGDYIVIYPETAHRGAVKLQTNEKVLKIVGKVRI